jgi:glycosyltransferase involved in cell wall biosynthesis
MQGRDDQLLSIVIPTYRGRDTLFELLDRLRSVLASRGQRYEVIVVNDASPDDTWELLESRAGHYPEVRAIDLLKNQGQLIATFCGMAHASGDLIATMDDDLQQPPEELPKLLDALAHDPSLDAVIGAWPRDEGRWRNLGSRAHAALDRLANGTPRGLRLTSFRVIRRAVADVMLAHETRTPIIGPILWASTARIRNVSVEHRQRSVGRSGFRLRTGVVYALTNVLQGSTLPLRLLARFGILMSMLAAGLGLALFVRWLVADTSVPGWTSSFLAIVFFGGASLFGIGILGEYVHLIVREVRRPPRWGVRREIRGRAAADESRSG